MFEGLEAWIEQKLAEHRAPSLLVGIAKAGRTEFVHASGFADAERRIPATPSIPYSLASVTKPMIGTALMILAERGLVDLHDPIEKYIPIKACEGASEAATIWRVANHTSGLPLFFRFFFDGEEPGSPPIKETIRTYANLVAPPGEAYVYSNIGYGVLGHLVEQVSGKPLKQFLTDAIFSPLGMERSLFEPTDQERRDCAVRYDHERSSLPHYVTNHPGASEAFASLENLLTFGNASLGSSPILSDKALAEMKGPRSGEPADQHYGLGWALSRTASRERIVSHSGGMDGVSTRLVLLPDRQTVIAILSNLEGPLVGETLLEVFARLGIAPSIPPIEAATAVPPDWYGKWLGVANVEGQQTKISLDPGTDFAEVNGQQTPAKYAQVNGRLEARIERELPVPKALLPHTISLSVVPRNDSLSGSLTVRSTHPGRIGNAVSTFINLRRRQ